MTDQQYRGGVAEAAFDHAAARRRLVSCKPNMDGVGCYDRIVDGGGKLSRVQVKLAVALSEADETWVDEEGAYAIPLYSRPGSYRPRINVPYSPADVDYVAGYVESEDLWYIVPVSVIGQLDPTAPAVVVYPNARDVVCDTEQYRDRWDLLRTAA